MNQNRNKKVLFPQTTLSLGCTRNHEKEHRQRRKAETRGTPAYNLMGLPVGVLVVKPPAPERF